MIAILLFFEKPLSSNSQINYDPTFVIEPLTTNNAQTATSLFHGNGSPVHSNIANLGVRRTQETALPTDRVVFIMNAL